MVDLRFDASQVGPDLADVVFENPDVFFEDLDVRFEDLDVALEDPDVFFEDLDIALEDLHVFFEDLNIPLQDLDVAFQALNIPGELIQTSVDGDELTAIAAHRQLQRLESHIVACEAVAHLLLELRAGGVHGFDRRAILRAHVFQQNQDLRHAIVWRLR
jgi:hypothetical protein